MSKNFPEKVSGEAFGQKRGLPPLPAWGFSICFLAVVFLSCGGKKPIIHSLDPPIGMLGGTLSIRGENFGDEQGESYISIAGIAPTGSSYLRWEDTLITLRINEFGEAGMVRIHAGGRESNALLFASRAAMPEPARGGDLGIGPRVSAVTPSSAQVGALVSIAGSGFGGSRERSGVFFSWDAEPGPGTPAEIRSPGFIEVSEADYGYELWSEREIQVRVPDGAVSGNVEIRTPWGGSRPVFFEVSGRPGIKIFRNKRSYSFGSSVDVRVSRAVTPNLLYLWAPRPAVSASQRNPELLSQNTGSFVENYRGTDLFRLVNLDPDSMVEIRQTWVVDVYAQETNLLPQNIKQDSSSPVHAAYTQAAALLPVDDGRIRTLALRICGRERNPYIKARMIYEWLRTEGNIGSGGGGPAGALEALELGRADPYSGALLFCSLARSAGIPAIPVAGVLINRGEAVKHYWAEFWIDGFGWIPLDPALGAGAAPEGFSLREDSASWYFGNLDNQRIAFSRGQPPLSQMDPRGRTVSRNRELQNLWEEAVGGLESYSSLWGDITITGSYVQ